MNNLIRWMERIAYGSKGQYTARTADCLYPGHMELEYKKKLFGLKPEPPKQPEPRKTITAEDAKEIVPLMEAMAATLREFCKVRNLDYNTIAEYTFEMMAETPDIWGCI